MLGMESSSDEDFCPRLRLTARKKKRRTRRIVSPPSSPERHAESKSSPPTPPPIFTPTPSPKRRCTEKQRTQQQKQQQKQPPTGPLTDVEQRWISLLTGLDDFTRGIRVFNRVWVCVGDILDRFPLPSDVPDFNAEATVVGQYNGFILGAESSTDQQLDLFRVSTREHLNQPLTVVHQDGLLFFLFWWIKRANVPKLHESFIEARQLSRVYDFICVQRPPFLQAYRSMRRMIAQAFVDLDWVFPGTFDPDSRQSFCYSCPHEATPGSRKQNTPPHQHAYFMPEWEQHRVRAKAEFEQGVKACPFFHWDRLAYTIPDEPADLRGESSRVPQDLTPTQETLSANIWHALCQGARQTQTMRNFLLCGPPGTGKTHTVKHVAQHLGVAVVQIKKSDIESKWVGETGKFMKVLFDALACVQPVILFADEGEALIEDRQSSSVSHNREFIAHLLQYLQDSSQAHCGVISCFATNMSSGFDPAILSRMGGGVISLQRPSRAELRVVWANQLRSAGFRGGTAEVLDRIVAACPTSDLRQVVRVIHCARRRMGSGPALAAAAPQACTGGGGGELADQLSLANPACPLWHELLEYKRPAQPRAPSPTLQACSTAARGSSESSIACSSSANTLLGAVLLVLQSAQLQGKSPGLRRVIECVLDVLQEADDEPDTPPTNSLEL